MLKVYFGFDKECIRDIDLYFDNVYDELWLDDELVKQMIEDIDDSKVVSNQCIVSPILGQIPPERLSGGVKALICLYKSPDSYIDLIVCGPNCEKWISKISALTNIRVGMSGYDLTFDNLEIQGICLNDNSPISNSKEWTLKMCKFVGDNNEG
jgi:hypothetical protein